MENTTFLVQPDVLLVTKTLFKSTVTQAVSPAPKYKTAQEYCPQGNVRDLPSCFSLTCSGNKFLILLRIFGSGYLRSLKNYSPRIEILIDKLLSKGVRESLKEPLTNFDFILCCAGDQKLNTAISASPRGDMATHLFLPEQLLGQRFQAVYFDSDGTNSTISDVDCEYFDIPDENTIIFKYSYATRNYVSDRTVAYIKILGIKF